MTECTEFSLQRYSIVPNVYRLVLHYELVCYYFKLDLNLLLFYTGGHNCAQFIIVSFNFLLNVMVSSLGV